ncbi:citryl-CoA lyase [Paraburkholderia caribensis]|uniref:citrate synthase (unknown stereospecificity) n=2 Tax=Paraburkholderia TaxID=1822464 RepID=B2JS13_PARP8|nr:MULTISPECIES: citryl-CoA lyase [Paraburkholderia]ACC73932.1 citrate synthase [Paraburkholderia phymatum STM815]MCO4878243.1 citryl-CoA lyase [Paraburkholderia caribensis]PTB28652.1 citryl-CoA lyase [Paraburkholderia caribensis]QLB66050.1 citryl-CoA lyase [Paraburkholderia caribensis]
MANGTRQAWETSVSDVEDASVYIRGYDLGELIGQLSFASSSFLLIRGRLPTPGESKMMEAVLCSVLDFSLKKPGTVAARYCVSGNPSMVAGLATAVLSAGEYTLAPDAGGEFIASSFAEYKGSGDSMSAVADLLVTGMRAKGLRVPGFGHPTFRYTDPRAQKLKAIAQENQVWGEMCDWYEAIHAAFIKQANKPDLVINEVGMLAAILAQMEFTPAEMTGLALVSTMPGVIAHVSEELKSKVRIRGVADVDAKYSRERKNLEEDLKVAGWR